MKDDRIYEPSFVAALFDEMSASYGMTNYVSSFGFCERWRRQAVDGAAITPGLVVVDLMSGMGESWRFLQRALRGSGHVVAVDFSREMCQRAVRNRKRVADLRVDVVHADALRTPLSSRCADRVVASFGLKTFSPAQLVLLGKEMWRLLKPGGAFSFVEIAVPRPLLLRLLYLFYLTHIIPVLGRLFLGNPDNYRLLAVYTKRFSDGGDVAEVFASHGFAVRTEDLFFGCARRITGTKPNSPRAL